MSETTENEIPLDSAEDKQTLIDTLSKLSDTAKQALLKEVFKKSDGPIPISSEDLAELRYAEMTKEDLIQHLGNLTVEQHRTVRKLDVLEESKMEFIRDLGLRHNIPKGSKWTVNLDDGTIILKEEGQQG